MSPTLLAVLQAVPRLARWLSLKELAVVSMSCKNKECQDAIMAVYDSTQAQQLFLALESCIPELKATLKNKGLAPELNATLEGKGPTTKLLAADKLLQQLRQVVSWLQQVTILDGRLAALADTPGLGVDLSQLFTVPHIPGCIADYLVQPLTDDDGHTVLVGLRISYQQLLAAARSRVAGVEVWVQAQQKLGVATDIPDIAVAICLNNMSQQQLADWEPPAAQDVVDVLQLALKCGNSTCAEQAATAFLPQITEPDLVVQLMLTAVERGHHEVMQFALRQPTVQQLTPAAVWQLMQAASRTAKQEPKRLNGPFLRAGADKRLHNPSSATGQSMMHWLALLPGAAAASSSPDCLLPLLQAAANKGCSASIVALCSLSTATTATAVRGFVPILRTAVANEQDLAVRALCTLPVAAHISAADCLDLLQHAVAHDQVISVSSLCNAPAAAHIHADDCISLLDTAMKRSSSDPERVVGSLCVDYLCSLPGLKQPVVTPAWWASAMKQALDTQSSIRELSRLPVAEQASAALVTELIATAIASEQVRSLEDLCAMKTAQDIPEEVVQTLLEDVIMLRSQHVVFGLQQHLHEPLGALKAVRGMSSEGIIKLVRGLCRHKRVAYQLVSPKCERLLDWLCNLTPARSVPAAVLAAEMQAAIAGHDGNMLHVLCHFPAAASLDSEAVLRLLRQDACGCYRSIRRELCKLPGASLIAREQLLELMTTIW